VKKYIMDNYSDPNLSLDVVADKVELSAGYLGKLFKSITSVSFNDYLNNIRLEKAKELLSTTNEPSSRICEKVGIYNITYFSTLFKKTYGVTPSAFRANSSRV
jgi:two-component system response regulator YesN